MKNISLMKMNNIIFVLYSPIPLSFLIVIHSFGICHLGSFPVTCTYIFFYLFCVTLSLVFRQAFVIS